MDEELFCKLITDFYGEHIDNVKQIVFRRFTGYELFELCKYMSDGVECKERTDYFNSLNVNIDYMDESERNNLDERIKSEIKRNL